MLSCRWGLSTIGRLATRRTTESTKALLSRGVVGATGFEPVTSSVSAKHREPLCQEPFSQVTTDRRGRRETLSFGTPTPPVLDASLHLQRSSSHCRRTFTCIHVSALDPTGELVVRPILRQGGCDGPSRDFATPSLAGQ